MPEAKVDAEEHKELGVSRAIPTKAEQDLMASIAEDAILRAVRSAKESPSFMSLSADARLMGLCRYLTDGVVTIMQRLGLSEADIVRLLTNFVTDAFEKN